MNLPEIKTFFYPTLFDGITIKVSHRLVYAHEQELEQHTCIRPWVGTKESLTFWDRLRLAFFTFNSYQFEPDFTIPEEELSKLIEESLMKKPKSA